MNAAIQRHGFGLAIAFLGVLIFTPDALLFRLTDAEPFTVVFWRGLLAGGVMMGGVMIVASGAAGGFGLLGEALAFANALTIAAHHLPAPEVSMIVLLEVVMGPMLV